MHETNDEAVLLRASFFISMAAGTQGLLTWEQQVHSTTPAPSSGSTSLVRAITFGQRSFHLGPREREHVPARRVMVTPDGGCGGGKVF